MRWKKNSQPTDLNKEGRYKRQPSFWYRIKIANQKQKSIQNTRPEKESRFHGKLQPSIKVCHQDLNSAIKTAGTKKEVTSNTLNASLRKNFGMCSQFKPRSFHLDKHFVWL